MRYKENIKPLLKKVYYRLLMSRLILGKIDSLLRLVSTAGPARNATILDRYVKVGPSPQNALDVFKDEWSSKLPDFTSLHAGTTPLFEDGRVEWALSVLGSAESKKVLELGPLEAGHTFMLERAGADSIVAIEANTRAYLKCLIIKEILDMKRARFLLGDFIEYLRNSETKYDFCFASGVLYHMQNPAELIHLISKASDRVYLWTHYYDEAAIRSNPALSQRFTDSRASEYKGFKHTLYTQHYRTALLRAGYCGGGNTTSCWMSRDEILSCLRYFGFNKVELAHEQPHHKNGPSFSIAACK